MVASNGMLVESQPVSFLRMQLKLVEAVIPEPTPESLAKNFRKIISDLCRMGLTGIHDFDKRTCFQALQLLHERGDLLFRVVKSIPFELLPQAVALGLKSGFGDDYSAHWSCKIIF